LFSFCHIFSANWVSDHKCKQTVALLFFNFLDMLPFFFLSTLPQHLRELRKSISLGFGDHLNIESAIAGQPAATAK